MSAPAIFSLWLKRWDNIWGISSVSPQPTASPLPTLHWDPRRTCMLPREPTLASAVTAAVSKQAILCCRSPVGAAGVATLPSGRPGRSILCSLVQNLLLMHPGHSLPSRDLPFAALYSLPHPAFLLPPVSLLPTHSSGALQVPVARWSDCPASCFLLSPFSQLQSCHLRIQCFPFSRESEDFCKIIRIS